MTQNEIIFTIEKSEKICYGKHVKVEKCGLNAFCLWDPDMYALEQINESYLLPLRRPFMEIAYFTHKMMHQSLNYGRIL